MADGRDPRMLAAREKRTEFERQALVHTDALFGAAYRLTRNARDAEDLVQDSLLRAFAVSEGYVRSADPRPPSTGDPAGTERASDETIDFEKYRAARTAREGSQS